MTDVLTGVLTRGTAKGLDLGNMPAAGKTGTTNDQKDGWFVGYTGYYTTSVWVGYDMPKKMDDLMGSTYPGKIWQTFMWIAHEGLEPRAFLPYDKSQETIYVWKNQTRETTEETVEGEVELIAPADGSQKPAAEETPQPSASADAAQEISPEDTTREDAPKEVAPEDEATGVVPENTTTGVSSESAATGASSGNTAAGASSESAPTDVTQEGADAP